MVELSYQMVLSTLQTIGLLVGIFYYITTLMNQQKTRSIQTFLALYNQFIDSSRVKESQELLSYEWTDYNDFETKYGTGSDLAEASKRYAVWYFWDGLGYLYRNGLIDENLIYSLNSAGGVTYMWKKFGEVIKEIRDRYNMPNLGVDMEYLAKEHKRMLAERDHDPEPPEMLGKYIPDN